MVPSLNIPGEKLEIALLEALIEIGGEANLHKVYPLVTKRFKTSEIPTGKGKWGKRINWTATALRKKGEMHAAGVTPKGIWAITEEGRERIPLKIEDTISPPTFGEEIEIVTQSALRLSTFQAKWMTLQDFKNHVKQMKNHLQRYDEIWMTGHFGENFVREIKGLFKQSPSCDIRILSINPGNNKRNQRALKTLRSEGAKVKIHPALHARIFIGYNESISSWETIVGSYDYNREGYGGDNYNASISSRDIGVVSMARKFFLELWNSPDTTDKI